MYVYCDVNLTSNIDDYKFTLGYVFLLSTRTINQSTQKQPYIVIFLTKAKCMVISQATRQVMQLSSLFETISQPQIKLVVVYDNNQSCIFLSKDPIFDVHIKHIEIHHHFMEEKVANDFIKLMYCNI